MKRADLIKRIAALGSNSEFNKLPIESPLRDAQRYASAPPRAVFIRP
jgi:hypothetical protein